MQQKTFWFGSAAVNYVAGNFSGLKNLVHKGNTFVVTDENLAAIAPKRFKGWNTIVIPAGEAYKTQGTATFILEQLIQRGANRQSFLVGVGGGVVTDVTGYVASVYMRGIACGLVPTTLLAMVDAAIGGKNGVDVGVYKNMVGTIIQPRFIFYDYTFLKSLPEAEWRNGFAEIIKHAAIKNAAMFKLLEQHTPQHFKKNAVQLAALIQKNVLLKTRVVQQDEREQHNRMLLNFGHTLGHALENQYQLAHGEAVAIGMVYAARLSQELLGFKHPERIATVVQQYGLPASIAFNRDRVIEVLQKDKKNTATGLNYILLEKLGKATIEKVSINQLYKFL